MSFAKPIFTTRGKQIELQGIEGQQIVFTKIKIGDGRITTQSPSQLTDLINVIAEAPITSLKRYDAYAAIRSVFQNIDVPEAFWWREVGLFAIDPATQEEVLYAYQNAYDTAEYITPSSLVTKKINWTIYIDDGENLGADIHKKMVFCSVEDLDEHNDLEGAHEAAFAAHNADSNAHADIRNKIGTDIAMHNTAGNAHADKFSAVATQIQTLQQNASLFMLPVKRNTTYAVGDCASATGLPSWAYLECVTAGTTDESEPDFSGVTSGDKVTYGTAVFIIRKIGSAEVANDVARISEDVARISERVYLVESVVNKYGSWYRKYSDGWIEQGGIYTGNATGSKTIINLIKPMRNNKYSIVSQWQNDGAPSRTISGQGLSRWTVFDVTTTSFATQTSGATEVQQRNWRVEGMGAS